MLNGALLGLQALKLRLHVRIPAVAVLL